MAANEGSRLGALIVATKGSRLGTNGYEGGISVRAWIAMNEGSQLGL